MRLGTHQLTQERVAMKFMQKSAIIASMGAAERATTEIQCLMALNHPNVIRLVQVRHQKGDHAHIWIMRVHGCMAAG